MTRQALAILIAGVALVVCVFVVLPRFTGPARQPEAVHSANAPALPRVLPEAGSAALGADANPATPAAPTRAGGRASAAPATKPDARAAAEPAPAAPAVNPNLASLHVESDVAGAKVFIDRLYKGDAPITIPDLAPGSHRLNVSADGYEGYLDTLDLAAGPRDVMVKFKDITLDQSIAVVHKHALGSCKGQLIATPQGIRYETTNKGDAFSAALLDVDTFQVDYLANNLRIVIRGKRYDFSDPDKNADHLFVFQREVEKVRQRLRKER